MSYESDITQREDLVHQIFLAIWQALPTFRGASSVKTFVGKIAQHRPTSHVAKRVREPRIAEVPARPQERGVRKEWVKQGRYWGYTDDAHKTTYELTTKTSN